MGAKAVEILCSGQSNRIVAFKDGRFVDYDIDEALAMKKDIDDYEFFVSSVISE